MHLDFLVQVERLISDHQSLLLSLDNAGGQEEVDFSDVGGHTADTLLLKIAVSC